MSKSLKRTIIIAVCAVLIIGIIVFDFVSGSKTVSESYIAMGTLTSTSLKGKNSGIASQEIKENIEGIESSCLSWRIDGSDVNRINSSAGKFVSVSVDTADWISQCIDLCDKSGGAFDITVGKLTRLWDFDSGNNTVPEEDKIKESVDSADYTSVFFNETAVKIGNDQLLDLGAVGKGIACDSAYEILESNKIKSAVVSVGGSILAYGKDTKVGIANPDNDKDYIGILNVKNKFISTSGDYERYFEKDGKIYHHILNPDTGYPAENDLRSVTVIADSGLHSDALSTACFVLGYKSALGLLKQYNAQAVFIFKDKTVEVTDGIQDSFKITDNSFTVK